MWISCDPPNVGPYLEQLYMECNPVWDSLTGPQPGLLTNENKKAVELYRYPQLETNH